MDLWHKFVNNEPWRRLVVLLGLIAVLYLARSLMTVILLTFIFSFLIIRLIQKIQKYLKISPGPIVVVLYLLIIGLLYLAVTTYIPKLVKETEALVKSLISFYNHPPKGINEAFTYFSNYISKSTIIDQTKHGVSLIVSSLTSVGKFGFALIMALLLSFFLTVELDQMKRFSQSFYSSPHSWLFKDIAFFARKFTNTFGVVLEAQFMIAIVNTVITTIALAIIHLPQLFSLALLIFVMSLVPVAGVIISAIPMTMIAYSDGGIRDVIYVLVMLVIIHALESYVLNPKFMSSKTELPIFYIFVVLFVSERLFGMWGLIVGIPIFTFFLDILGVKPVGGRHKKFDRSLKERLGKKNE